VSGGRLAAIRAVVPPRHLDGATRLDVVGAVTVTAATGSFIYGMLNAGEEGWTDLGTLLPSGAAIVLYGVLVLVERTVPAALMRLNLLARCPIAVGGFLMLVAAGLLIAGLFLGSQYLQHPRGLSALETGLFARPGTVRNATSSENRVHRRRFNGMLVSMPYSHSGLMSWLNRASTRYKERHVI
jgi:hypothetical protein